MGIHQFNVWECDHCKTSTTTFENGYEPAPEGWRTFMEGTRLHAILLCPDCGKKLFCEGGALADSRAAQCACGNPSCDAEPMSS